MFSKNREDVNDLFQEVLLHLWKGYGSFRNEADIKTWIYRVSFNCCMDQKKKSDRYRSRIQLDVKVNPFEEPDEKGSQIQKLYSRIQDLGYFERGIILLWLEGLSYDEIASIAGISVKNVSYQLVQIKKKLIANSIK